jgi:hypothetical protein
MGIANPALVARAILFMSSGLMGHTSNEVIVDFEVNDAWA